MSYKNKTESLVDFPVSYMQFEDCFYCLKYFNESAEIKTLNRRLRSGLEEQLFFLLQFMTICTNHTLREMTVSEVETWLEPSRGFSEFDLRIRLLRFLGAKIPNPAFEQFRMSKHPLLNKVRETLFWRGFHRRLTAKTRRFFESISQQDIIDAELRCQPYYKAYHQVYFNIDTAGVFTDSDKIVAEQIRRMGFDSPSPNIVDIGCGNGRLLMCLAGEFSDAKLTGTSAFPLSGEYYEKVERLGVKLVYCTASDTGLPDQSYDIVVSTEVIEHLRHPEEMVREIHRILKPGGFFCVTAPAKYAAMYCRNPFSYFIIALSVVFPRILPPFHNLYSPLTPVKIVHYAFEKQDLERLFRNYFNTVKVSTSRFTALKKFRMDKIAPRIPILRDMGGLCIVTGRKAGH